MCSDTSGSSEEEKPIFRPLTRDSLAQIQARIDTEHAKKKELQKKRAEGEVSHSEVLNKIKSISFSEGPEIVFVCLMILFVLSRPKPCWHISGRAIQDCRVAPIIS